MTSIHLEGYATPIDCYLESDHVVTAEELKHINETLDNCNDIITMSLVPEDVKQLAKKHQVQQLSVDSRHYEYMLTEKAYNDMYAEPTTSKETISRLSKKGFKCKDNGIYDDEGLLAKFDFAFKWIQLKPETKTFDKHIIFTFPDSFKIYLDNMSISNLVAKELCFCGQYDIDFKQWEKVNG